MQRVRFGVTVLLGILFVVGVQSGRVAAQVPVTLTVSPSPEPRPAALSSPSPESPRVPARLPATGADLLRAFAVGLALVATGGALRRIGRPGQGGLT